MTRLLALLILLLPTTGQQLSAQVDAALILHGRDAQMVVANPSNKPLRVSVTLFKDSTLADTVPARISPHSFTLQPGQRQVVRLRLRETINPGASLRLGTTFTPVEEEARPQMRLVLATRMITRVRAGP